MAGKAARLSNAAGLASSGHGVAAFVEVQHCRDQISSIYFALRPNCPSTSITDLTDSRIRLSDRTPPPHFHHALYPSSLARLPSFTTIESPDTPNGSHQRKRSVACAIARRYTSRTSPERRHPHWHYRIRQRGEIPIPQPKFAENGHHCQVHSVQRGIRRANAYQQHLHRANR